jgi:hypothetical protein
MIAGKKNGDSGPHPVSGTADWVLMAMLVFCLAFGVRQMFHPATKEVDSTKHEQNAHSIQPFQPYGTAESSNRYPPDEGIEAGNPLADKLAELIQGLQAEDDPMKREQLIANLLAGLKTGDIAAALAYMKDAQPAELAADLSRRLVRHWAESSPREVAAWINGLPDGDQRQAALDGLAIVWANSQMVEAINWGQSLAKEGERNRALTDVANEAVRTDPMTALQLAVGLPADVQRDDLIRRATMEWTSGDATNAVAWAEQIPDATLRVTVLAGEAVAWAKQDPESAAMLAVRELPAGRLQEDTVVSIVQRWAELQPEAAAAWVAQFPEGAMRAATIENLVTLWSRTDAAAAQQWLASHT